MLTRAEERKNQINKLKGDLTHLIEISKRDERLIVELKSRIHDYPIKRYEHANVDLQSRFQPICSGTTEYYAAYLYVKEHKKEVDKEISRKKQQLSVTIKRK